jgi:hypothetical protein
LIKDSLGDGDSFPLPLASQEPEIEEPHEFKVLRDLAQPYDLKALRKLFKKETHAEDLERLWEQSEEKREHLRQQKNFGFGQKIPSNVKPFDKQELTNKQFSAKHSSFLRILTKWAGYLEDILKNPE